MSPKKISPIFFDYFGKTIAALIILLLVLTIFARLRLIESPMERDEGEYAYAAQICQEGGRPYADFANMKNPGIYYVYKGAFDLFGSSAASARLAALLANLLMALTCAAIIKECFGAKDRKAGTFLPALAALAAAIILEAATFVQGFYANSEHFLLVLALGGMFFLLLALKYTKYFWFWLILAGLLLGASFCIKQHGVFFCLAGAALLGWSFYLQRRTFSWKKIFFSAGLFFIAGLLPFLTILYDLYNSGVWDDFILWTVKYAEEYATQRSFWDGLGRFFVKLGQFCSSAGFVLPILSGIGIVMLVYYTFFKSGDNLAQSGEPSDSQVLGSKRLFAPFVLVLTLAALAAASVGFHYYGHYFLYLIPSLSLLGAAFVALPGPSPLGSNVRGALFCLGLACVVFLNGQYLFFVSPDEATRMVYPKNPFPETKYLGLWLKKRTPAAETIGVIGSEPQINFYAQRRSPTSFFYVYPLTEKQPFAANMRAKFIRDMEAKRPYWLIFVNVATSWDIEPDMDRSLFAWLIPFWQKYYELTGVIDLKYPPDYLQETPLLFSAAQPFGFLGAPPPGLVPGMGAVLPKSENFLLVLRRRK